MNNLTIVDSLLGKTSSGKQHEIHSGEAFALWQHLVMRYDIRELTDIFQNFANDTDLKTLLTLGTNVIDQEITLLENQMNSFGIPLPPRPPKSINTPTNTEVLRDELMFRIVFMGLQNFASQQVQSFLAMQNPQLKQLFEELSKKEMDYIDKMGKYGKFKGWQSIPPQYSVQH